VNKEDVALAVFDYNLSRVQAAVELKRGSDHTVKGQLLDYVRAYGNFIELPFPEGGCPLLNTAVESDDTNPELRSKACEALEKWKGNLQKLVQEGISKGEFDSSVNAEQVALTLIATLEGAIMITKLTGKLNYRKAIIRSIEKIIQDL
jgi:TetR/AcrR family transcriptional regulator, transcriptional repressor for nem operon